jgi:toxin ParE1/3/4
MTLSQYIKSDARQDIKDIGKYLEEQNSTAARRFVQAIDETIEMLCRSPDLGERLCADPTGQIRYRTISGFKNYLIFYRREDTQLQVLRILHGAREYEQFFE